jgi:hypothetical protein
MAISLQYVIREVTPNHKPGVLSSEGGGGGGGGEGELPPQTFKLYPCPCRTYNTYYTVLKFDLSFLPLSSLQTKFLRR